VGRSIEDVQRRTFLADLPRGKGRFRYRSSGLNAPAGTVLLFQFKARIIASAVFLRDEKFEPPRGGYGGAIYVEAGSVRTFEPVDVEGMRKAWAGFRGFGHVKQWLNPVNYSGFRRRLRKVELASGAARR
jgi:hypothetical protein